RDSDPLGFVEGVAARPRDLLPYRQAERVSRREEGEHEEHRARETKERERIPQRVLRSAVERRNRAMVVHPMNGAADREGERIPSGDDVESARYAEVASQCRKDRDDQEQSESA